MQSKKLLKTRQNKFTLLIIEQAQLTEKGLELLTVYLQKRSAKVARQISQVEKEEDEVRRILIEELMKSFITPFDREDIFALSREVDDILDYANTTVDEMEILDVNPTAYMQLMAKLLHDASMEIRMSVERLQDKHFSVCSDHTQRAKSLENRVENTYREALGKLFKEAKNVKAIINMLKVREIYRHLSNAADRIDGAADVISDIIMKSG